jgi:hypothetical protein
MFIFFKKFFFFGFNLWPEYHQKNKVENQKANKKKKITAMVTKPHKKPSYLFPPIQLKKK